MTILISSDWQLDDNPLNAYRHEWQKQLRAIIKKHDVKLLLMLGDLTEQKDRHGAWLVNKIVDHLDRLRCLCDVVIVRGNHDYVDANAPFYEFLRHIRGITWINAPTDASEAHLSLELVPLGKVLFLPNTVDHKRDWHGIKLKKYDWIFTHNTFAGADAGMGIKLRGIPTNIFSNGQRVISGDIHVPQRVGTNVEYVGAPYLCDFGDNYAPRVLLIDQVTTRLTKKIPSVTRSIPVTGPQKRLVEMETDSLADLERGAVTPAKVNPGDILKVRVEITGKQRAEWPAIKARVREWGEANGYLIHVVQPILSEKSGGISDKRIKRKHQSDDDLLRTYAKHCQLDQLTLKAGMNLIKRA